MTTGRDGQLLSSDAGEPDRAGARRTELRTAKPDMRATAQAEVPAAAPADPSPAGQPELRAEGARHDWVPWLVALAVFAAYLPISLFRYLRFDPTSWDLGIFTEYVKQLAHLRAPIVDLRSPGYNALADHFHPIVALLAPFFRLFPTPVTLLVAQALLAAVSVIPVSRVAARKLGTPAGRVIGAAYGFSWGLQQMVNYDFHEIAFAVPLLAFCLSAMIAGRIRTAVLWALPLVFVKEDQGFTLAAIGLIIAVMYQRRGRSREALLGVFLGCWGLVWSILAITVIIPHFSPQHSYYFWSQGGVVSPDGGHFSPGALIAQVTHGASQKLPTLAMIMLPTAFIALRSPVALAVIPSLALRFVGTNPYYWTTDWHYNATVMPIVFIAAIDAIARIAAARQAAQAEAAGAGGDAGAGPATGARAGVLAGAGAAGTAGGWRWRFGPVSAAAEKYGAAAMAAIAAALAFSFPLSQLWTPATYDVSQHVAAARAAMARVPDGAQVATDLDLLAPLAARTDTFWLGNYGANPATKYIVFDTASTDWQPPPQNVLAFVESLTHGARYRQIFARDGVYVFIRAGS